MEFTPKKIKENVNIPKTSPIKEFFVLMGGTLGIMLAIYILLGFAVNLIAPRFSYDIERKIGNIFLKQYVDEKPTSAEQKIQELLDSLVIQLDEQELTYKTTLINDPLANAMAFPGGHILIFSGLLKEVESENDLAFILAHELGHFANRDHLKGLGRMIVLVGISTTLLGADHSVTDFLINSIQKAEMKFSQKQETAADLYALDMLNEKYGHVGGAKEFFMKISKKNKMGHLRYYFTSHPHPENRMETLSKEIISKGYLEKERKPLHEDYRL